MNASFTVIFLISLEGSGVGVVGLWARAKYFLQKFQTELSVLIRCLSMGDSFFTKPSSSKKRNRYEKLTSKIKLREVAQERSNGRVNPDEDITSQPEDEMPLETEDGDVVSDESDHESAADKRRRLAREYLADLETELVDGFDAKDLDDDIINRRLVSDAAEQQGNIFRDLREAEIGLVRRSRPDRQRNLTSVCCAQNSIYLGSKDSILSKWTLNKQGKPFCVRKRRIAGKECRNVILCLCVNTANKLVVTGHREGFAVHNAESLELMREFKVRGDVLSLAFRRNTSELYVGGSDLRLRTYDLKQWAFVETLHGHQDEIVGLSALSHERCISVGARDRTVIFWKIPEASRLTFRGGDTKLAAKYSNIGFNDVSLRTEACNTILEGSIDCCAMLDHSLFVTGSDNGNVSLWSTNRKKPQHLEASGHGFDPYLTPTQASGEQDGSRVEIPPRLPRSITAITAVPFSNVFFTGSWCGNVRMWALSEDHRQFNLVREIAVGTGIVTSLAVLENKQKLTVVATISREPRLGRWHVRPGRDAVAAFEVA